MRGKDFPLKYTGPPSPPLPQAEKMPWLTMGQGGGRFWGREQRKTLKTFSL